MMESDKPSGRSRQGMETKGQDASYWNQCIEKVGASRDKAAFGELFAHFSPALKAFLVKSGGVTPEIAEELVQDAMIKVWRKAPTFSPTQASASTWIYTIARNTRIDWLRKQANQDPNALTAEDIYDDRNEPSPYSSLVQLHDKRRIKEHIGALPSEQAEVLQMMYFQGKSGQQVADILEVPLGTVKSRIRLAMEKLKIALAPAFQDGLSEGNNI